MRCTQDCIRLQIKYCPCLVLSIVSKAACKKKAKKKKNNKNKQNGNFLIFSFQAKHAEKNCLWANQKENYLFWSMKTSIEETRNIFSPRFSPWCSYFLFRQNRSNSFCRRSREKTSFSALLQYGTKIFSIYRFSQG